MTQPPALRWLGRCWPQRVRTRLAVLYAALFLVGGSALLGLTYGLVASSLPAHSTGFHGTGLSLNQFAKLCKKPPLQAGKSRAAAAAQCKLAAESGANAASAYQRDHALHSLLLYSLIGLGLMTLASGGAGWLVSGRVLQPVRMITETARRASEEHLGERIGLTGARDELKELADTFDDMLERLDLAFSAQRRFVANASHELRTPLTIMRTAIDVTLAKPSRSAEQLAATAVRIRRSIDRAESMIEALLTLSISDQGPASREPLDLATTAEDALDVAAVGIGQFRLRVHSRLDPAQMTGDPHLIERLVGNLVDNAVRHNEPGGQILVHTGTADGTAFLEIVNTGRDIPENALPGLFEPFRRQAGRTGAGAGAGLGLSIARSIVTAHGATVAARGRPGGGLEIRVAFPLLPA